MEKICRNCRWWESEINQKLGDCNHKMIENVDYVDLSKSRNDGILIYGDMCTSLETGPNFGCIHWGGERKIVQNNS